MPKSLSGVKQLLYAILVSAGRPIKIEQLVKDYYELEGTAIPFKDLGYGSLDAFVRSIPDIVKPVPVHGEIHITYCENNDNPFIKNLVDLLRNQRTNGPSSFLRCENNFIKGDSRFDHFDKRQYASILKQAKIDNGPPKKKESFGAQLTKKVNFVRRTTQNLLLFNLVNLLYKEGVFIDYAANNNGAPSMVISFDLFHRSLCEWPDTAVRQFILDNDLNCLFFAKLVDMKEVKRGENKLVEHRVKIRFYDPLFKKIKGLFEKSSFVNFVNFLTLFRCRYNKELDLKKYGFISLSYLLDYYRSLVYYTGDDAVSCIDHAPVLKRETFVEEGLLQRYSSKLTKMQFRKNMVIKIKVLDKSAKSHSGGGPLWVSLAMHDIYQRVKLATAYFLNFKREEPKQVKVGSLVLLHHENEHHRALYYHLDEDDNVMYFLLLDKGDYVEVPASSFLDENAVKVREITDDFALTSIPMMAVYCEPTHILQNLADYTTMKIVDSVIYFLEKQESSPIKVKFS